MDFPIFPAQRGERKEKEQTISQEECAKVHSSTCVTCFIMLAPLRKAEEYV